MVHEMDYKKLLFESMSSIVKTLSVLRNCISLEKSFSLNDYIKVCCCMHDVNLSLVELHKEFSKHLDEEIDSLLSNAYTKNLIELSSSFKGE